MNLPDTHALNPQKRQTWSCDSCPHVLEAFAAAPLRQPCSGLEAGCGFALLILEDGSHHSPDALMHFLFGHAQSPALGIPLTRKGSTWLLREFPPSLGSGLRIGAVDRRGIHL